MRLPAWLLIPSLCAAEPAMTARFENDDLLKGQLVAADQERGLIWDSSVFPEPQPLSFDKLREVNIPTAEELNLPPGDHVAVVKLTNGDEIQGNLLSVTEEGISIETSFGGELVFRRDMVAKLDIEDRPELIYAGPKGPDEWLPSLEDGWTFEEGVLVCNRNSSISRDIGEHMRMHVAFDIAWQENARFRVYLHADHEDLDEVDNCYELVCQSQYAYLRKRTKRGGRLESTTIGTTGGVREFQDREKVRVEMLQDRISGRIRLMLGGRVVADWSEQAPDDKPMGPFLHFLGDMQSSIEVSRIRITTWDGLIDGEWDEAPMGLRGFPGQMEEPAKEEPEEEGILLRNGDRIEGDAIGIEDGMVRLKTSFKEFSLPVSRLRTFALRTAEEAEDPELCWKPIRRAGDIRAWFPHGGAFTFELIGIEDGKISGRSQTFGDATFDLDAFSRLEFNIYAPDRRRSR